MSPPLNGVGCDNRPPVLPRPKSIKLRKRLMVKHETTKIQCLHGLPPTTGRGV